MPMMNQVATIRHTMRLLDLSLYMNGRLLQLKDFFKVKQRRSTCMLFSFLAFSTIMFAFAGASTFPTIQADMKDRRQFPLAAISAMLSSFSAFNCSTMLSIFSSPIHLLFHGCCGVLSAW